MNSPYVLVSLASPITLSGLKAAIQSLLIIRSFNYATLTLLLWDMVLTLRAEIAVVWTAPLSVVKVLFLTNRYLTPAFVALHLWTFSGHAVGLNNTVRIPSLGGLPHSLNTDLTVNPNVYRLAEILSISAVSLVILLRLYALYELSSRAFYGLIAFWFITLVAVGTLLIFNFWLHLDRLVYTPSVNICLTTIDPTAWTQWVPRLVEHGVFCLSLIFNAMSTPRPAQTRMLAMIYRDGIMYYAFTFSILLLSLLMWRFAGPLYIGLAIYSTGLFLTMATSRLLLSIKTSDSMRIDQTLESDDPHTPGPLRQQPSFETIAQYSHQKSYSLTNTLSQYQHAGSTEVQSQPISIQLNLGASAPEGRTVRLHATLLRKRAWWLFGATYNEVVVETRVEIKQESDLEGTAPQVNGVQVSRLGRYDQWL